MPTKLFCAVSRARFRQSDLLIFKPRARSRIIALVVANLLLALVLAVARPANAAPLTATCSAPSGSVYRVTWNVENSSFGPLARISGLHRQQGTTWIDEGMSVWQLRWEFVPTEIVGLLGAFKEKTGNLAALVSNPVAAYLSPNLVVPDGSCVVYLYPFAQGSGAKVAVVGDSLIEGLRDSTYNATWLQGYVQGRLGDLGRRAEVEGHGGRRWSPVEGSTGRAKADSYLLDEVRGLRSTPGGLRAIVIGLGANDAAWVSLASDAERERRLNYVLTEMQKMLTEVLPYSVCTVVVTTPDNLANWGGGPWAYAAAAQSINNWLRIKAASSTTDALRLEDWAAESWGHHSWNAENWFATDNLHLNDLGKQKYAAALARAGTAC